MVIKFVPKSLKGLPKDFLQPKATENRGYPHKQPKNSHGQDACIQYSCRGFEDLQDGSDGQKQPDQQQHGNTNFMFAG